MGDFAAAISALASRQDGLVHRDQLVDLGLSRDQILHLLAVRWLHRVLPRVYAVGHLAPAKYSDERAALLWAGPRALLSHRTAGWIHRICPRPDVVELTIVGANRNRIPSLHLHRIVQLDRRHVHEQEGLLLTGVVRTLADLASTLAPHDLERAVSEAQIHHHLTHHQLSEAVALARRGAKTLREIADDAATGFSRNDAERRLYDLLRRARLPLPKRNHRIGRHEVDFAWPDARLILEFDGFGAHRTRRKFESDARRTAELTAAGYRVIRITWRQLTREPEAVLAAIAASLAMRAAA